MLNKIMVLGLVLVLSGCTYFETAKAFKAGVLDPARLKVAMEIENVRCKRPPDLVIAMAALKGDTWMRAYVHSCPNWQALMRQMLGLTIAVPSSPIVIGPAPVPLR